MSGEDLHRDTTPAVDDRLFVNDYGDLRSKRAGLVRTMDRLIGLIYVVIMKSGNRYANRSARNDVGRDLEGALQRDRKIN